MKIFKIDVILITSLFIGIIVLNSIVIYLIPFEAAIAVMLSISISVAIGYLILLRRQEREKLYKKQKYEYQQIEALFNLHNLIDIAFPLPRTRIGASSPDVLEIVYKEILIKKPRLILECGSGVSSIIMGYALRNIGRGLLISLEHDLSWFQKITGWITEHNLSEYSHCIHAPLMNYAVYGGKMKWYDMHDLQSILKEQGHIDLLYVDGPPFWIQPMSRLPAMPLLKDYLSSNSVIILDDANRSDEKEIIKRWSEELQCQAEWIDTEKGTVIMRLDSTEIH